ncbi:MAG: DUF4407 domain-containing protein [Solirubrobacteraceae bacterium]
MINDFARDGFDAVGAATSGFPRLTAKDLAELAGRDGLAGTRVPMSKFTERVIRLSMGRPELITTTADKGSQFAISGFLVYYFCYGMIGLSAFMLGLNGGHHAPLVRAAIILGAFLPVCATLLVDLFFATRSNARPEAIEVTGDRDQDLASANERVRKPVGPRNRWWLFGRLMWAVMVGFVIALPVANFFFGHDVAQQQNQDAYNTYQAENARQDAGYLRDEANARRDMNGIDAHYEALNGKAAAALNQHVGALAGVGPSGQRIAIGQGPVESGLGELAGHYQQQAKQYLASKQLELQQDQTSINNDQTAITELDQNNRSLAHATTGGLDDDTAIWQYLGNHPSQIPVYVVITLIMILLDCGVVILKMLTHNSTYARTVAYEEITINYLRAAGTLTVIERSIEHAEDAKVIADLHRTLRSQAISDKQNDPAAMQLYRQLVDAELRQRVHPMINQIAGATPALEPDSTPTPNAHRAAPAPAPAPAIRAVSLDEPQPSTDGESFQWRDPAAAPTANLGAGVGTDGGRDREASPPSPEPAPAQRPIGTRPPHDPASDRDTAQSDLNLEATQPTKPATRATTAARPTSPSAPPMNGRSPSKDQISTRAYFLSREERREDDVANWLEAERELAMREHREHQRSVQTKRTQGSSDADLTGSA